MRSAGSSKCLDLTRGLDLSTSDVAVLRRRPSPRLDRLDEYLARLTRMAGSRVPAPRRCHRGQRARVPFEL